MTPRSGRDRVEIGPSKLIHHVYMILHTSCLHDSTQVAESTLAVLRTLCAEPQNHVMILSGVGRDKVINYLRMAMILMMMVVVVVVMMVMMMMMVVMVVMMMITDPRPRLLPRGNPPKANARSLGATGAAGVRRCPESVAGCGAWLSLPYQARRVAAAQAWRGHVVARGGARLS